jgi:chromatin remodeling complex protein RSC6
MATKKKGGARKKVAKKSTARKSVAKKGARKKAAAKTARKSTAKSARKASAKSARKTTKKATRKAAPKKRTPNAAFMRPVQPDEALSAVVGSNPMPRTELTKKLWAYIRKNGLQDPKEKRMINADDKLSKVFGGKKRVSMFDMTKLVSQHVK